MFHLFLSSLLSGALLVTSGSAERLFAAQVDGNITTLALTQSGNTSALTITSVTGDCESSAGTLNLDFSHRILYCLDEGKAPDGQGSLNSFSIDAAGKLTRIARVSAPHGVVAADYFDIAGTGIRGMVSASFNQSAIGVFRIGQNGSLAEPSQVIFPTLTAPGPVLSSQDRSYVHDVIIDPTDHYILIPDIGGDMIRVFKYDKQNVAPLHELPSLHTKPGTGPRHAVFWRSPKTGKLYLFFNGELDQKIYSYRIDYTDKGLRWTEVFAIVSVSDDLPATTAPTSEIAVTPDGRFVIVSNRDVSYPASPKFRKGPTDTFSVFSINFDGTLTALQLAPTGGYQPRQFSINNAGDKIAVGHKTDNTVVIWKRDIKSGLIVSEADGGKLGVVKLPKGVVFTQWYE